MFHSSSLSCINTVNSCIDKIVCKGHKFETEFVIHFVGAEELELEENEYNLIIDKLKSLGVHDIYFKFIGPNLLNNSKNGTLDCIKYSTLLYHDFINTAEFIRPNIICFFNPGFWLV
jgi:hypothetical protein